MSWNVSEFFFYLIWHATVIQLFVEWIQVELMTMALANWEIYLKWENLKRTSPLYLFIPSQDCLKSFFFLSFFFFSTRRFFSAVFWRKNAVKYIKVIFSELYNIYIKRARPKLLDAKWQREKRFVKNCWARRYFAWTRENPSVTIYML